MIIASYHMLIGIGIGIRTNIVKIFNSVLNIKSIREYVTIRAKTSLVHTSNFATLEIHNFCYNSQKQFIFT